jgi:cation diffusion facilitator CzcD-associated flavoprotein CzcO
MASRGTDLLIVGAGPFGLAMAAQARHQDLNHVVLGAPMQFWRGHMPAGMYLRSDCEWHLDPQGIDTIEAFLRARGQTPADVTPLSRELYLEYASWFQARKRIEPDPLMVQRLDGIEGSRRFRATLEGGDVIDADNVVLALGFAPFTHVPGELARLLPSDRVQHACHAVDFAEAHGRRYLIVGGRQSAFEWAALLAEAGAGAVHVSHRHDSPAFSHSDWSWVDPLVERLADDPGWYRRLDAAGKEDVIRRLWSEGRLKLEPWLETRVRRPAVSLWPNSTVSACAESGTSLAVTLSGPAGPAVVVVDRVILATGYKPDIGRVPLLARGNLRDRVLTDGGLPVLDDYMQASVPGLFITSMLAVRDFGPFLAFTGSVRVAATLIGRALASHTVRGSDNRLRWRAE